MIQQVVDYVRADLSARYGLRAPVTVTIGGSRVSRIVTCSVTTRDGSLTVEPVDADQVTLTAHPFPASTGLWNGPNVIPDGRRASMIASLYHDLIWGHDAELASAWECSALRVRQWGNGVLRAVWLATAEGPLDRTVGRIAWRLCRWSAPVWPAIKRALRLGCLAVAVSAALGCASPPDWSVIELEGEEAVEDLLDRVAPDAPAPPVSVDAVPAEMLSWDYGGLDGSGAELVPGCVIADLHVDSRGMSYRWESGGCEDLGARHPHDAACLACLFVLRGGRWRGGKFDWISTDRLTRSFANVHGNYHGWSSADLAEADDFAFVVISRDGRRRSNVIRSGR